MVVTFTKQQIKNYLINRSMIVNKAKSLEEVLEKFSCIQVDPINVVARTHEVSLWNRIENFKRQDLYDAMYKDRTVFEYWFQLYSFIPIKYRPYLSSRINGEIDWRNEYYKEHKVQIAQALEYITGHGPTSAAELSHIPHGKGIFSWNNAQSRTALLMYLWDTGEITVSYRKHNRKYFDLTERIIPKKYLTQVSEEESIDFITKSYFSYFGLVTTPKLYRIGYSVRQKYQNRLKELLASGEVVKVKIEQSKSTYMIMKDEVEKIEKLGKSTKQIINILSPLDPIVWDRKILKEVFESDYQWEVYVPPVKRKFAYYGFPILYKGEIVGQVELEKVKNEKLKMKNKKIPLSKLYSQSHNVTSRVPKRRDLSRRSDSSQHTESLIIKKLQLDKKVGKDFQNLLKAEVKKLEKFVYEKE